MQLRFLTVLAVIVLAGCSGADRSPPAQAERSAAEQATEPGLAESMGLDDPPSVSLIRQISPAESQAVWQLCLKEAGWDLVETDGADPYFDVPVEQEQAFNLARYVCYSQYPVADKYTDPLSQEQLEVLYEHWTSITVPCFEELGYDVGDVPTRESFLANPMWHPAIAIQEQVGPDVASGRWPSTEHVLYEVCPAPADEALYGD